MESTISQDSISNLRQDRQQSAYKMIEMQDAFTLVQQVAENYPVKTTSVLITSLECGMVAAEDILSKEEHPAYPASVMDGYAVTCIADHAMLRVVGKNLAGINATPSPKEIEYTAVYVTTGAQVPNGYHTVVPIENVTKTDDIGIMIHPGQKKGQFIRAPGSDIAVDEVLVRKGTMMGPAEIALVASVGVRSVQVYDKIKIGVMSSGNELVAVTAEHDIQPSVGQIRDTNKLMLSTFLRSQPYASSITIVDLGTVLDEGAEIDKKLQEATTTLQCDIVLTSGGVSMGERDLLKPYLELKGKVHFGRLNMKPGKPTTFGELNSKLVFALPGNPVSSYVTSSMFIPFALGCMLKVGPKLPPLVQVKLLPSKVKIDPIRPEYHRCIAVQAIGNVGGPIYAISTGIQNSSRLLSAQSANCLAILPAAKTPDDCNYICNGQNTFAHLLSGVVLKSEKEINEIISALDGQSIQGSSCCAHKQKLTQNTTPTNPVAAPAKKTCTAASNSNSQSAQSSACPLPCCAEKPGQKSEKVFNTFGLTVSTRAFKDQYETGDLSGKALREVCEESSGFQFVKGQIVSDDKEQIKKAVMDAIQQDDTIRLVLVSGGTGFTPDDVTPEAISEILTKRADSLTHYLQTEGLKITPMACLARTVIGTISHKNFQVMVVTLPGKPKAIKENMEILCRNRLINHALAQCQNQERH